MKHCRATTLIISLVVAVTFAVTAPQAEAADRAVSCKRAIGKTMAKYVDLRMRAMTKCLAKGPRTMAACVDLNDPATAALVTKALNRSHEFASRRCAAFESQPAVQFELGYGPRCLGVGSSGSCGFEMAGWSVVGPGNDLLDCLDCLGDSVSNCLTATAFNVGNPSGLCN